MAVWDTYIQKNFGDLREGEEWTAVIRDLTPGRTKYRSTHARIKISLDPDKYPERLWIRLGRGQLIETPCSMQILEFIDVFPKGA